MKNHLCYDIQDDRLSHDLAKLLGWSPNNLKPEDFSDLNRLRHIAKKMGWVIEVRETSPETFGSLRGAEGVSLFMVGRRAVLVSNHGQKTEIILPTGSRTKIETDKIIKALEPDIFSQMAARRKRWLNMGIRNDSIRKCEKALGPEGTADLDNWFSENSPDKPQAIIDLVLKDRYLAPIQLGIRKPGTTTWLEIIFTTLTKMSEDRSPWLSILEMVSKESGLMVLMFFLALLSAPLGFAMASMVAFIMDQSSRAMEAPWSVFGLIFVLFFLNKAVSLTLGYVGIRLGGRLKWRLTRLFSGRILDARLDSIRKLGDGDLFTRLTDLGTLQNLIVSQVLPLLFGLATLAGGGFYLLKVAPFVILPTFIGAIMVAVFLCLYIPKLKALRWDQLITTSFYRDRVLERLEGRRVFRHLDPDGKLFKRIDPYLSRMAEFSQQGTVLGENLVSFTALVGILHISVITWLTATRYQGGEATLGALTIVIGLSASSFLTIQQLINLVPAIVAAGPSVSRVKEIIKISEPEPMPSRLIRNDKKSSSLDVEELKFSWTDESPVLQGATFSLKAGSWTCLVGPSGCGKSTLAGLLGGLFEATSGRITLDGQLLKSYSPGILRSRIAQVSQEPFLFSRTIRENLIMNRKNISEEELGIVLQISNLTEFVSRQPRGMNQPVGENGVMISQGEKSRICLARALLNRPGILVLDETLAHLDNATREAVRKGLRSAGVTILILTHDLAQARYCDQVLMMTDGRITESGTYRELTETEGPFARLHASRNHVINRNG